MNEHGVESEPGTAPTFTDLALSEPVLQALAAVGYEAPSPIQAATIPVLLAGNDMLGQAQTGTGKTAAFALPVLSRLEVRRGPPQCLVLVPTRELAIQVAEAFQRYASAIRGFHVLPIYGGQSYTPQLMSLQRGAHVVVGTPGRVMDHIKRGTLDLGGLSTLVLDEADEMLQMGFVEDIEWILGHTPPERQVALFSATMPAPIRRIAQKHLREPVEVTIRSKTSTATNIRQRYWVVSGVHKLDALTRILEAEPFDGMLIFARTKQSTLELSERLEARGFAAAPLNGDMQQKDRERTVSRLKNGQLDILVATDVAARGLDVERIGHVVNYDIPYDTESYVHRIGRTGRAGRKGEAILFVTPRERNMLRYIERATRQPLERMDLPTIADVNEQRVVRFRNRITDALADGGAEPFRSLIEEYEREHDVPALEIAAALASLLQGGSPLLLDAKPARAAQTEVSEAHEERSASEAPRRRHEEAREHDEAGEHEASPPARQRGPRAERLSEEETETYRIAVGYVHGVKPGNIVGAIANVAGLEGSQIGHVDIREDHTYVGLPQGMPDEVFQELSKTRVAGQMLRLTIVTEVPPKPFRKPPKRGPAHAKKKTHGPKTRDR
ncbi:MAG TPA: DEAD/DEAH box helicase [Steroidobacteraceae bacterium]|nr:DEAD/DEAH box helicase [Steroidobacteraceae bacterium]